MSPHGDSKKSTTKRQGRTKKDSAELPARKSVEPSGGESTASLDIGACCLCHCSLDFSDRAAFFQQDRHEDYQPEEEEEEEGGKDEQTEASSYFFRPQDPYLPTSLYDPCNALVYCDSCDRMFHQKCHFVPVLLLPRGAWHCLLCQTKLKEKDSGRRKRQRRDSTDDDDDDSNSLLFRSPPNQSLSALECAWEESAAHAKALAWKQQLAKLKQYCQSQLASHRQASTALDTLASTRRNRLHYFAAIQNHDGSTKLSQELLQILVKLFTSKWKIREAMINLEAIRLSSNRPWETLQTLCSELQAGNDRNNEFVQRVLCPFGTNLLQKRRAEPRTREMQGHDHGNPLQLLSATTQESTYGHASNIDAQVPTEVTIVGHDCIHGEMKPEQCHTSVAEAARAESVQPRSHHPTRHTATHNGDDNGSGISLDDLQCCICLQSSATDDNDMVLCDGRGCYRSYHQDCIVPRATVEHDDDDDWFCPLCVGIADLLGLIQGEFMGDDWEQRRYALAIDQKPVSSDSLKSWDGVDEVFPESKWEFEAVCLLRNGKRTADTRRLLAMVLGEETSNDWHDVSEIPEEEEDDDDDDEEDFDPERPAAADDDDADCGSNDGTGNDDAHSSQVSLGDLSSVELDIRQEEIAALSEIDGESDESDDDGEHGDDNQKRRSQRLRKRGTSTENSSATASDDQGKLDTANIVAGKRFRKSVDYVKLNEAMFGDASDTAVENLDDAADYEATQQSPLCSTGDGSDDDDDGDSDQSSVTTGRTHDGEKGISRPSSSALGKRRRSSSPLARGSVPLEATRRSKRARRQSPKLATDESDGVLPSPTAARQRVGARRSGS